MQRSNNVFKYLQQLNNFLPLNLFSDRKLLVVVSSTKILFSNARHAGLHSVSVHKESTLVNAEKKHSLKSLCVGVKPTATYRN